jgi:hypothetical protein
MPRASEVRFKGPVTTKLSPEDVHDIAVDAYVFGYPLVLMDVTRRLATATARANEHRAPINQFCHMRRYPDDSFADIVSPNADTLYSTAWIDLSFEPLVLSVPDIYRRYYLMPILDAWTNVFASPGSRTTGNDRTDFVIAGPHWIGPVPDGLTQFRSPTNTAWIIGRTQTNGSSDYAAVHAIQDQFALTPLSMWGLSYTPPTDVTIDPEVNIHMPPIDQVSAMDAATFFSTVNALLVENPPALADAPTVARLGSVGIAAGRRFTLKGVPSDIAHAFNDAIPAAQARIVTEAHKPIGRNVNGWDVTTSLGAYGTHYLERAVVALTGLGANLPEDAIYPHATTDAIGRPLHGGYRYQIRFPKGQLPPVDAFWSIALYNAKQAFARNPIGRYAIGDRDPLVFDDDGSLTLYVQHDAPYGDERFNWLPAPREPFNLCMRLYWPQREIVDGTWKVPPIERVI